jgi:hypothetical protein
LLRSWWLTSSDTVGSPEPTRSALSRVCAGYQSNARPADALAVLAPALEGFSPTPEMAEIAEAQALLESLARGGEGAIPAKDPATEG